MAETSWSLIGKAAGGEPAARSAFGHAYLPLIRSFLSARWRHGPLRDEVDDAVQETFVECFRRDGPLQRADRERGDFRGYLFGIVRHVARRHEERRLREAPGTGEELGAAPAHDEHASRVFDREWARTMMLRAGERMQANALDAGARLRIDLLRLRFQDGLAIRDIAAQWEMDPDAVHRAYARARAEFHACLRHVVAEHAVRSERDLDDECRCLLHLLAP